VHARDSPIIVPVPQLPPEHTIGAQPRVCVPAVAHVPAAVCMQALHAEQVGAPQVIPSVLARVQDVEELAIIVAHEPDMHVEVVIVVVCIPLVLQGVVDVHAPITVTGAPQVVPSVVRVHGIVSIVVVGVHVPLAQCDAVTMRVCVPLVAQVVAPMHAENGP